MAELLPHYRYAPVGLGFKYAFGMRRARRRALASPRAAFRTDPRCLVQARGDGAHLVLREPGDAYLLGYPLHLAGARAGGVHLGDGGNGRGPRAGGARSRRPGRSCRSGASGCAASACRRRCERPLAVAVSAVRPATAQLVGLGVHRGVHDLFGESGEQLPHVDGAVAETGHGEYVRRRV